MNQDQKLRFSLLNYNNPAGNEHASESESRLAGTGTAIKLVRFQYGGFVWRFSAHFGAVFLKNNGYDAKEVVGGTASKSSRPTTA